MRYRINVDGFNNNLVSQYNLNLVPIEDLTLLNYDSRFFKLGSNGQYVPAQIEPRMALRFDCTSDNLFNSVGLRLCVAASAVGPKKFQVKLENSELIKRFTLDIKKNANPIEGLETLDASLSSNSDTTGKRQLDLSLISKIQGKIFFFKRN